MSGAPPNPGVCPGEKREREDTISKVSKDTIPIYNDVNTWRAEWKEKDIRELLKDHLPPGARPNWRLLTFNFKDGTTEGLQYAQTMLDKLLSPKVECSIDELFANSPTFVFNDLASSSCPYPIAACDMDGAANFISKAFVSIHDSVTDMQSTVAVVLTTASGIGKTFATLAVTSALRQTGGAGMEYFPIALYLGFNADNELTPSEKSRLKHGEDDIRRVLARRLLFQLHHLSLSDVAVDESSLWDVETNLQRMPMPVDGWNSCPRHLGPQVKPEDIFGRVNALLDAISSKVCPLSEKPIHLILIVDEGQRLDEYCTVSMGGARCAMRWLRELQRQVKLGNRTRVRKHKLLGIMTGIDPQVSLSDDTDGRNLWFDCVLHEMAGFQKIADELVGKSNKWYKNNPTRKRRLATTFYPHARELMWHVSEANEFRLNELRLPTMRYHHDDLARLMLATGLRCNVSMEWFPRIPAVFEGNSDQLKAKAANTTPQIPQSELSTFMPVVGTHMMIRAMEDCLKCVRCPYSELADFVVSRDDHDFERISPLCLSILMVLLNYKYSDRTPEITLDENGERNKYFSQDVLGWLTVQSSKGAGVPLVMYRDLITPLNAREVFFPSSVGGTHAEAFATADNACPALHPNFDISSMMAAAAPLGRTVFYWCRESAPVDIICVTLVQKAEGDTMAELQIRLVDAKQVTSIMLLKTSVHSEMRAKFGMVENFLKHHLSKLCTVTFMPPALVTTATDVRAGEDNGVVVISPTTCNFRPLTDWWFSARME